MVEWLLLSFMSINSIMGGHFLSAVKHPHVSVHYTDIPAINVNPVLVELHDPS